MGDPAYRYTDDQVRSPWQQMKAGMLDPQNYYKMPAVGITETRARVGDVTITQFTIRCGAADCWYVGHAMREQDVVEMLGQHTCPTAPARNELPTGYSTLEKLWDELDEATSCLLEQREWKTGTRTFRDTSLQAYCRGLAFALSMMTHPHFKTADDISREAVSRYKMRTGKIPFRQTPTYRYNPMPAGTVRVVGDPGIKINRAAPPLSAAKPVKKAAKKVASKVDMSKIDTATAEKIKQVDSASLMSRQELAGVYGITVETVNAICGS